VDPISTDLLEPDLNSPVGAAVDAVDRRPKPSGRFSIAIPLVVYAIASVVAYWPLGPINGQRIVGCGCGDIALQTWFLAWPAHALTHGLNPFFTDFINVPKGVNLASNTSMVLLGLLAAPVTRLVGAVAAFNLFMQLAFFASATSMYLVLRRWTSWWPAAFLGGLFYGFSSYMVGEGLGHLFLLAVPIPPLVLAVVDDLTVRGHGSPRREGLLLGMLAGFQYLISAELFADMALIGVLGVLVLAVRHPRAARLRARRVGAGGLWALVPFGLLAGFPVGFGILGPQHVTGPWAPPSTPLALSSDLLGPFIPTYSDRLGAQHWKVVGSSFAGGGLAENGVYLGIPLVLACVFLCVVARRNGAVRFAGAMAVVSFVVSMGPRLHIDNHLINLPLPFALLSSVPLVREELPIRYALFTELFVAVLFAVGLDELRRLLVDRRRRSRRTARHAIGVDRPSFGVSAAVFCLAVAVVLPLLPAFPYATATTGVPAYFTSDAPSGVRNVPVGSVVLTYPYPVNPNNFAMLWQAVTGMRFRILGDYAITPAPDGSGNGSLAPPLLEPALMQTLFGSALIGGPAVKALPPVTGATVSQLRRFLLRYGVASVIVDPVGADPQLVVRYLSAALGKPPDAQGGVLVWYDVQELVRPAR
jgi:hypothetical protein